MQRYGLVRLTYLTVPAVLLLGGLAVAAGPATCDPLPTAGPSCSSVDEAACCDPADEPIHPGTQYCPDGYSCCGDGTWRCNDDSGLSSCAAAGPICERCCDPAMRPDGFDCDEGASCCSDGRWRCNEADGGSTCDRPGEECRLRCCDPAAEPGAGDIPPCIEGATCCSSGDWACNTGSGEPTCTLESVACESCCDPREEPGHHDNPPCFEGATCCASGEWTCNAGDGTSTCEIEGQSCPRCCDVRERPGSFDNPPCDDDQTASCCTTGEWECVGAIADVSCNPQGDVCESRCCDPRDEPGAFGNPTCFEGGASCCSDGRWRCNDGSGTPTCDAPGAPCERCCDPTAEPGTNGIPPCVEGASCCGNGQWTCNAAGGFSTCPTPGRPCDGPCCDGAERPNEPGNPYCATGFECCGDGRWQCNDLEGRPTCDDGFADECLDICGGIAGIPCEGDEFCRFREGECCCDQLGVCVPIPDACPEIYDPVCGCDGNTYSNECEAGRAGVSVASRGPCEGPTREVEGLRFRLPEQLFWEPHPEALVYNVYAMRFDTLAPTPLWSCIESSIETPWTNFNAGPGEGQVWWILVSAVFSGGEGPLGYASDGRPRGPVAHCPCTQPADPGPCDAAIPRWYYDVVNGTCETFVWGGCEANGNNFETREDCEDRCP